jgi:[CysO sulfur-carrier protein]-S-L-cysteine hydrolase
MITNIILTSHQHDCLVSLAKDSLPNESCALLVGNHKGKETFVLDLIPMKNSDASIISFSIAPQELIDVYQTVEKQGMEVVGIFHSHPAQPLPSSIDKKFMQINPVVWIIYSTITNEAKAYIFEENIRQVQLRVIMA